MSGNEPNPEIMAVVLKATCALLSAKSLSKYKEGYDASAIWISLVKEPSNVEEEIMLAYLHERGSFFLIQFSRLYTRFL